MVVVVFFVLWDIGGSGGGGGGDGFVRIASGRADRPRLYFMFSLPGLTRVARVCLLYAR